MTSDEDPVTTPTPPNASAAGRLGSAAAGALVFTTSAAVLVIEILAGRLLAPYVGISLETFTGIIGTVLAAIAVGAWAGGVLADAHDPAAMIGPAMSFGGALTWLSLPLVSALGPELGSSPPSIIMLTAVGFFAPCAVLSSVSPMVAKLRLRRLDDTGAVVGGLSAVGTVGGLAGTYLTGFVLISAAPTRPIVLGLGAALVAGGIVTGWALTRRAPSAALMVALVASGVGGAAASQPCQHETAYFCVRVEVDADDPSLRSLYLDQLRHAAVDLDDPTSLDIRYVRLFAEVASDVLGEGATTLHIGGGGFTFPRYLQHIDPSGTDIVLEIDEELVRINEAELGLVETERLQVRTGDARLALRDFDDDRFDLVVGDAYASTSVPWHLTTIEFIDEIERVLRPGGIYMMNVIDGGSSRFARAELATLAEAFEHLAVIIPHDGIPSDQAVNQVLLASSEPIGDITLSDDNGRLVRGDAVTDYIDGARSLRDDFAPVDQLIRN